MIAAGRRTLIAAGIALAILFGLNLWLEPNTQLEFSPTSFGVGPTGYKASFELASALGLGASRSYVNPKQLPRGDVLWLVAPFYLAEHATDADRPARDLLQWIRLGGTAVVLGDRDSKWERLGFNVQTLPGKTGESLVENTGLVRRLSVPDLARFGKVSKDATVEVRANGDPFVIRRSLGTGTLVAVADYRFLLNANLGSADNCLFFADLAYRFNAVIFDERSHGMLSDVPLYSIIARSRAMLPIGAGLILAVLWVFAQNLWPRRTPQLDSVLPSPTIEPFVASIGVLYARSSDPAAAFHAYRNGFVRRLGRKIMPFGEFDEAAIMQRLSRDRSMSAETRDWLVGASVPKSDSELIEAIRSIEGYSAATYG
jgi:uncharacterized protein DUF4350